VGISSLASQRAVQFVPRMLLHDANLVVADCDARALQATAFVKDIQFWRY
jgi:hypothetical protein